MTALERAREVASAVTDPELPVLSIGELGMVRDVVETDGGIEVAIAPTYIACPAMAVITMDVEAALHAAGFTGAHVRITREPPWTTDWITPAAREKLRLAGIAPPGARGAAPACPQCGSADTEEIAPFGATACKALWRCRACREPFEHFKCH